MYSPINHHPSTREILKSLDKLIDYMPAIKTIRVTPTQYEKLYKTIPMHLQYNYKDSIPYRGKVLIK